MQLTHVFLNKPGSAGFAKPYQQRGAILVISLIILVLLTLITFTASKDVLLQQKMTSAVRDNQIAFEVAEEALLIAESQAASAVYALDGSGTTNPDGDSIGSGFYDGANCDASIANCHVNTVTDLFNPSSWTNSQTATIQKPCDKLDSGDCEVSVTYSYIIIDLGEMDNFGLSSSQSIRVITDQYVDKKPGTLANPSRYKVIAKAITASGSEKVLVSYFAASKSS